MPCCFCGVLTCSAALKLLLWWLFADTNPLFSESLFVTGTSTKTNRGGSVGNFTEVRTVVVSAVIHLCLVVVFVVGME